MSVIIMGMGAEEGRGHPFADPRGPGLRAHPFSLFLDHGQGPSLSVLFGGGTSPAVPEFPWAAVPVDNRLSGGGSAYIGPYPIIQGLLQPGSGMTGQHCQDNSPTESALEGWLESCRLC